MKIAFDHQIFTLQKYGGISRYCTKLAQELGFLNQQVGIFAPLYRNNYVKSLNAEVIHGRYVSDFPHKTASLFAFYNDFVGRAMIKTWRPDILHETYYLKRSSNFTKCPVILTVYDTIPEIFTRKVFFKSRSFQDKKHAIKRADHIICISNSTKHDLIEHYDVPVDKISVVLLGFDHFNNYNCIQKSQAQTLKPFLLYVGPREGYKNFSGFLRAVSNSSSLLADFNIVAFGGAAFSEVELSMIRALGFSQGQVCQISGDDLLLEYYYKSARAFVYPSLYEGFGIPPLEAMANKCPVIASNTSSMPEVIGNAAEFFNPADIDDMRCAIESVVYSEDRMESLKLTGSIRLTNFSWTKCAEQTLSVYRKYSNGTD